MDYHDFVFSSFQFPVHDIWDSAMVSGSAFGWNYNGTEHGVQHLDYDQELQPNDNCRANFRAPCAGSAT